ncbi:unnamed protein product, partial [Amoebophrya sp. A120]|eukprot:GSA120T00025775001.1
MTTTSSQSASHTSPATSNPLVRRAGSEDRNEPREMNLEKEADAQLPHTSTSSRTNHVEVLPEHLNECFYNDFLAVVARPVARRSSTTFSLTVKEKRNPSSSCAQGSCTNALQTVSWDVTVRSEPYEEFFGAENRDRNVVPVNKQLYADRIATDGS